MSDSNPKAIYPVAGVQLNSIYAGIRKQPQADLSLLQFAQGSRCAAVFTQNAFCAAPVHVAKAHLQTRAPRYCLINAGNANAGTGEQGMQDAKACCAAVARAMGCDASEVLPFSTGVIGQTLPMDNLSNAIPALKDNLRDNAWQSVAEAIMTTDTMAKISSVQLELSGKTVTITGVSKGSGMIHPNMATMLAFIATDASLDQAVLDQALSTAADLSFNCITVDGDTSTNDACVLAATGQANVDIDAGSSDLAAFQQALNSVCLELAQAIIHDAEGATKFITIEVEQGQSRDECRQVAYTIAHSPLVKTAFFASDANWGRILAAVGRAGVPDLDIDAIEIYLDDVCIVKDGGCANDYTEAQGAAVMAKTEILVRVVLGRGEAKAQIWTSDLSHDYVKINAEYRT